MSLEFPNLSSRTAKPIPRPYSAKSEGVPALHFVSAGMTLFWMAFYLDAFLVIPLVHQTALSSVTRQIAHRQ